jgi:Sulfotransferase family
MHAVFIGGCGRSGTTMLGAMLGAHSDCLCTPESFFLIDLLRKNQGSWEELNINETWNRIKNHWRIKIWELDKSPFASVPENMESSLPGFVKWMVRRYGQGVGKPDPAVWIDHTPSYIKYAPVLFDIFPGSKMIHMVRDGRAVAASVIPLDWGPNNILSAANWWAENLAHGLAAESYYGKERVLRVRYEDLVQNPAKCVKEICSFIGISFQDMMTSTKGFKVPDYTRYQHRLVGEIPQVMRIKAWEQELTQRQIDIFDFQTKYLLTYLGYFQIYNLRSNPMKKIDKIKYIFTDIVKNKFINRLRRKRRIKVNVFKQ